MAQWWWWLVGISSSILSGVAYANLWGLQRRDMRRYGDILHVGYWGEAIKFRSLNSSARNT